MSHAPVNCGMPTLARRGAGFPSNQPLALGDPMYPHAVEVKDPRLALYERWLARDFWPLMGAEDETPEEKAAREKAEEEARANETPEQKAEREAKEAAAAADDDDDDDDNDDDDDDDDDPSKSVQKLRDDLARMRTQLTAAEQAAAKAKKEARDAKHKAAKESGNWEEVAKTTKAELDDVSEQLKTAEERAVTAEANLDEFQRTVRVTNIASRLGFKDPADAIALLKKDDTGDDKTAERALRKLATDKDYLVDQRRATGRAMNGGANGGPLFTKEQLENMSQSEITANWDKVQASMAALPVGSGSR